MKNSIKYLTITTLCAMLCTMDCSAGKGQRDRNQKQEEALNAYTQQLNYSPPQQQQSWAQVVQPVGQSNLRRDRSQAITIEDDPEEEPCSSSNNSTPSQSLIISELAKSPKPPAQPRRNVGNFNQPLPTAPPMIPMQMPDGNCILIPLPPLPPMTTFSPQTPTQHFPQARPTSSAVQRNMPQPETVKNNSSRIEIEDKSPSPSFFSSGNGPSQLTEMSPPTGSLPSPGSTASFSSKPSPTNTPPILKKSPSIAGNSPSSSSPTTWRPEGKKYQHAYEEKSQNLKKEARFAAVGDGAAAQECQPSIEQLVSALNERFSPNIPASQPSCNQPPAPQLVLDPFSPEEAKNLPLETLLKAYQWKIVREPSDNHYTLSENDVASRVIFSAVNSMATIIKTHGTDCLCNIIQKTIASYLKEYNEINARTSGSTDKLYKRDILVARHIRNIFIAIHAIADGFRIEVLCGHTQNQMSYLMPKLEDYIPAGSRLAVRQKLAALFPHLSAIFSRNVEQDQDLRDIAEGMFAHEKPIVLSPSYRQITVVAEYARSLGINLDY
ncbi:hypothetical protein HOD08_01785 [bacterium]|nr:hypothetical protein [bacterium]